MPRVVGSRAADDGRHRTPISSSTASRSSIFSSSERVGDSPVVPATTTPCEPFVDQVRREPARALDVERAIVGERRDHRRQDSLERRHRAQNYPANVGAMRSAHGSARSSCAATWIRRSSRPCAATSWMPTGSPSASPSGSEIAGWPVTLKMAVKAPSGSARVERVHRVVARVVPGAERLRRPRGGRREQEVEAREVPARDHPGEAVVDADVLR